MSTSDAATEQHLKSSALDGAINEPAGWRRATIAAYLVVIALGLPYWWFTTSIERLALPVREIEALGRDLNTTLARAPFLVEVACETAVVAGCEAARQMELGTSSHRGWTWTEAASGDGAGREIVRIEPSSDATAQSAGYHKADDGTMRVAVQPATAASPSALVHLLDHTFPHLSHSHRAIGFAPNVTLSFVSLNEDSSAGRYVSDWPVVEALEEHLLALLRDLTSLHTFSIETQILYHAPLRFQPAQRVVADGTDEWVISDDQMKGFVNTEQWSLDSGSSNNPVLRFLLFVPSTEHTPLRLASSTSPAFLIPQYGGVVIHNTAREPAALDLTLADLDESFRFFSAHLSALLGLPSTPDVLARSAHDDLAQWQLSTLMRMRARENFKDAVDTLGGIVRLVAKIREMKVGRDVQRDVQEAVAGLQKIVSAGRSLSPQEVFDLTRDAVWRANRAFFHPDSVGLLYFPSEHRIAVYGPLFAPVAVPLLVSLIKEFKVWKAARRRGAGK